jgi:DNA-directed RNA polymerase subunit beta'
VVSRSTELKLVDVKTGLVFLTHTIFLTVLNISCKRRSNVVSKGTAICKWDPYNGVIISEFTGKIAYEDLEQGQSYPS